MTDPRQPAAAGVSTAVAGSNDPGVAGSLTLGLIDADTLSRECLVRGLQQLHTGLAIFAFPSVKACVDAARNDLEMVIYRPSPAHRSDSDPGRDIRAACAAFGIPVIVLSDAVDAQQAQTIRTALLSGARGFIATRTTGLAMLLTALRFVGAGGTFAPLEFLLGGGPADSALDLRPQTMARPAPAHRFTGRQFAVLGLLRQGKANKIIAHELGMSESTVKVHVRNIMRAIGATNRTEVAYRLRDAGAGHAGAGIDC